MSSSGEASARGGGIHTYKRKDRERRREGMVEKQGRGEAKGGAKGGKRRERQGGKDIKRME